LSHDDGKPKNETHFILGSDKNDFTTDFSSNFTGMMRDIHDTNARDNKLRLSKSNFVLGSNKTNYQTTNSEQMSWKQPIVRFED